MPRTLQQLKTSSGILSGVESQTLRTFCTSEYMNPTRDLKDPYGQLFENANITLFRSHFQSRVEILSTKAAAAQELFHLKWGPTEIPVYNVILAFTVMKSRERSKYLALTDWLIQTAKIPVDGTDMSGTTALMHSISTKPYLDTGFAQMLIDAGADINHRNRFGCTTAHGFVMVSRFDPSAMKMSCDALRWFLEHGGDPEIRDGDDVSATFIITRLKAVAPGLEAVLTQSRNAKTEPEAAHRTGDGPTQPARGNPCPCASSRQFKKCCGKDEVST